MSDILVEHDTIEDTALLNLATWHLFNTGVALDVDGFDTTLVDGDCTDGLEGKLAHEVGPAHNELCADGGLDEGKHLLVVCGVNGDGYALDDLECLFESLVVCGDDNDRVYVALELRQRLGEDFSSWKMLVK